MLFARFFLSLWFCSAAFCFASEDTECEAVTSRERKSYLHSVFLRQETEQTAGTQTPQPNPQRLACRRKLDASPKRFCCPSCVWANVYSNVCIQKKFKLNSQSTVKRSKRCLMAVKLFHGNWHFYFIFRKACLNCKVWRYTVYFICLNKG